MSLQHLAEVDETGHVFCRACEADAEPVRPDFPCCSPDNPDRLAYEPGDIAELITRDGEVIKGLCIKPAGAAMGWVLTDGTRLPLRPYRTFAMIRVVSDGPRLMETENLIHDHTTPPPETTNDA